MIQPPWPVSSAFAPKAHCVLMRKSDLKDVWVSATLGDVSVYAAHQPYVFVILYLSEGFEVCEPASAPMGLVLCFSHNSSRLTLCFFVPSPPPPLGLQDS